MSSDDILFSLLEIDGNESDIDDMSDNDDGDETFEVDQHLSGVTVPDDCSSSDSDNDNVSQQCFEPGRRVLWRHSEDFDPSPPAPEFVVPAWVGREQLPMMYFINYIGNDFFEAVSTFTNMRYLSDTGKILGSTSQEMKVFLELS